MVALPLTGCFAEDDATKAGGSSGPVTLRLGTPDVMDTPAGDQIQEFGRRVRALSDDQLRIEPVWHAAGPRPGWDDRTADMLTDGELDLALIPSRAWDSEGVASLRALNTPFLVTSDELLAEVLSGEMARKLMSGLDEAGVIGLALFPEGLRHPFGFERALLGPADYRGQTIRAGVSETTYAMFEALGAKANEKAFNAHIHAGAESSYVLAPAGTAAGNVTFYPKVSSLVVSAEVFGDLTPDQRETLERAATGTRKWAIETSPTDAEAARTFCADGGAIVSASEREVAALKRAVQPVIAELQRDRHTKEIIDAIREMKQSIAVSAAASRTCGDPADAGGQEVAARSTPLDGVYRFEVTDEQLRAAGVTEPGAIAEEHGLFTWTFSDGGYCWEAKAPNEQSTTEECDSYSVEGDRLVMNFPTGPPDVYRWRKTADGDLDLTYLSGLPKDSAVARAWVAKPWTWIADAE